MTEQLLFLGIVALGCYTQAITGFALGLILVALSSLFNLMSVELASIVVSIISITNTSLALAKSGCKVRWRSVGAVLITGIPATFIGVLVLERMGASNYSLLRLLLGITIIGSSLLLVFNPRVLARESSTATFGALGFVGWIPVGGRIVS